MSKKEPDGDALKGESFSQPMGLLNHLQRTDTRLDFVPVLDIVVIVMLVSLLFTRFVMLPGIRVDLPATEMRMQHSLQPVAVLTIGNNGMLFFGGGVYESDSIASGFEQYIDDVSRDDLVLLVKAESSYDLQDFLQLCRKAQEAGFVQVQLAGRKETEAGMIMPIGSDLSERAVGIPVL